MLGDVKLDRHYLFMDEGRIAIVRLDFQENSDQNDLSSSSFLQTGKAKQQRSPVIMFISVVKYLPPSNPNQVLTFHQRLTTLDNVQVIRRIPSKKELQEHLQEFEYLFISRNQAISTLKKLSGLTGALRRSISSPQHETLAVGFFAGIVVPVTLTNDPLIDHAQLQRALQQFLMARQTFRQLCDFFHVRIEPLRHEKILKLWFWNEAAPRHHVMLQGPSHLLERYLHPVKVPTRVVAADLPAADHLPVRYQIGHSHFDKNSPRGFAPPPRVGPLILVTGGASEMRIGTLQRLAVELIKDHDHVIILDLEGKFTGLSRAISRQQPEIARMTSMRLLRLGTNFFMNPCHVRIPLSFKQNEEQVQYQADLISRMIIAATRPWKGLEWKESLTMALKNYLLEEQETKGQHPEITFEDVHRMLEDLSRVGDVYVDVSNLESIRHVIARYAAIDALNHRFFKEEQSWKIMDGQIVIFQTDQNHALDIKRLCVLYLLHYLVQESVISSKKMAIILSPASALFLTSADRRSTATLTQLQKELILPFFDDVLQHELTLVLSDPSHGTLPLSLATTRDAIFLRAYDVMDASIVVKRIGLQARSRLLEQHSRPEDLILQLMDDEALLLRQDSVVPQYVILDPLLPVITRSSEIGSVLDELTTEASLHRKGLTFMRFTPMLYAVLMTILEQLTKTPHVSRVALLSLLKSQHPEIDVDSMIRDIQKLPHVLITHRNGMETYQMTRKGMEFLQEQQAMVASFPPPHDEKQFRMIARHVAELIKLPKNKRMETLNEHHLLDCYQRLIHALSIMEKTPWYHVHHCLRWKDTLQSTSSSSFSFTTTNQRFDLANLLLKHCDELVARVSVALRDPMKKQRLLHHLSRQSTAKTIQAENEKSNYRQKLVFEEQSHPSDILKFADPTSDLPIPKDDSFLNSSDDFLEWLENVPILPDILEEPEDKFVDLNDDLPKKASTEEIFDKHPINQSNSLISRMIEEKTPSETLQEPPNSIKGEKIPVLEKKDKSEKNDDKIILSLEEKESNWFLELDEDDLEESEEMNGNETNDFGRPD